MRHDPERLAARFLDGHMRRPERWRFERHLVECGECWRHVRQARAGRSAAESLRVVAPARVRDRIRAIPELDAGAEPVVHRRHRPMSLMSAAVATVFLTVIVGVVTHSDADHAENAVASVATAYRDTTSWAASNALPPMRSLAGLRWVESRLTTIDDDRVLGYRYTNDDGTSVLVVQRDGAFATPPGAEPVPGGEWVTAVDGVTIFCTHLPESVLVAGTEPGLVAKAARALTAHADQG